jgi:MFS family permease
VVRHRELLGTLSGGFLALGLAALDQAIVTPALPAIAHDLHGLGILSWVVTAYLLTSTTLTLAYGKLSDIHGRATMIRFAIVIFVAASVLCALAQNMAELVAARALQGVGAGGIPVMAQAMVGDVVPPRERGRYQSFVSVVFAVALVGGPPLGGALVGIDWRWIFWINLPLGALAFALVTRSAARIPRGHGVHRIDLAGLTLLGGAVTAFLLLCSWGGTIYPWASAPVAAAAAAALALGAAFRWRERRSAEPIFPARVFAQRAIRTVDATNAVMALLQFGGVVLAPVFLQLVLRLTPAVSGVLLIPMLAGTTIGSVAVGQILHRTGRYAYLMPVGLATAALGYFLLATFGASSALPVTALYLALIGGGIGTVYPISNTIATGTVARTDIGVAMSSITFSRALGGACGAAVFWSLLLAFVAGDVAAAPPAVLAAAFRNVFLVAAGVSVVAAAISARVPNEALGMREREVGAEPCAPATP